MTNDSADVQYNLATMHAFEGRAVDACDCLKTAIDLSPDFFARAEVDISFNRIRKDITELLEELTKVEAEQSKAALALQPARQSPQSGR